MGLGSTARRCPSRAISMAPRPAAARYMSWVVVTNLVRRPKGRSSTTFGRRRGARRRACRAPATRPSWPRCRMGASCVRAVLVRLDPNSGRARSLIRRRGSGRPARGWVTRAGGRWALCSKVSSSSPSVSRRSSAPASMASDARVIRSWSQAACAPSARYGSGGGGDGGGSGAGAGARRGVSGGGAGASSAAGHAHAGWHGHGSVDFAGLLAHMVRDFPDFPACCFDDFIDGVVCVPEGEC